VCRSPNCTKAQTRFNPATPKNTNNMPTTRASSAAAAKNAAAKNATAAVAAKKTAKERVYGTAMNPHNASSQCVVPVPGGRQQPAVYNATHQHGKCSCMGASPGSMFVTGLKYLLVLSCVSAMSHPGKVIAFGSMCFASYNLRKNELQQTLRAERAAHSDTNISRILGDEYEQLWKLDSVVSILANHAENNYSILEGCDGETREYLKGIYQISAGLSATHKGAHVIPSLMCIASFSDTVLAKISAKTKGHEDNQRYSTWDAEPLVWYHYSCTEVELVAADAYMRSLSLYYEDGWLRRFRGDDDTINYAAERLKSCNKSIPQTDVDQFKMGMRLVRNVAETRRAKSGSDAIDSIKLIVLSLILGVVFLHGFTGVFGYRMSLMFGLTHFLGLFHFQATYFELIDHFWTVCTYCVWPVALGILYFTHLKLDAEAKRIQREGVGTHLAIHDGSTRRLSISPVVY
jgi:hypothetical protein